MRVKPAERVNGASVNQAAPEGLADMPSTLSGVCPYFGLADDPQTRLLFASPAGCCHRVEPVAHVALDHQQTACLTSAHVMCPVFKRPEWDTLPPDLIYRDPGSRSHRFWPWLVVGLVGLALLWGVFWIGGDGGFLNRIDLEPTPAAGLAVGLPLPTKTTTPPPSKTAVPTATTKPATPTHTMIPSATAEPSATPTSLPTTTPSRTLAPTYTPVPTETAVPSWLGVVSVERLNVRTGPGIEYEVLATVDEGRQFELTGRLRNSSWWRICCINGESGWIIAEAMEIPEEAETAVVIVPASTLAASPTPGQ